MNCKLRNVLYFHFTHLLMTIKEKLYPGFLICNILCILGSGVHMYCTGVYVWCIYGFRCTSGSGPVKPFSAHGLTPNIHRRTHVLYSMYKSLSARLLFNQAEIRGLHMTKIVKIWRFSNLSQVRKGARRRQWNTTYRRHNH